MLKAPQLAALGHSVGDIRGLVRRGELVRARRGVYLVGPRLAGVDGWFQDVALAAADGPSTLVSGQAAAALYGFDGFDPGVPIVVQVARSTTVSFPGARRLRRLEPSERVSGIWCTSPGETLLGLAADLDAAAGLRRRHAAAAVGRPRRARRRGGTASAAGHHRRAGELCARADGKRPGRDVLVEVLARRPDQRPTESYLETRVVQLLRDAGLPTFDRQVELTDEDGFIGRVDLSRASVVIEALGKRWHLPTFDPTSSGPAASAPPATTCCRSRSTMSRRGQHVVRTVARALARADRAGLLSYPSATVRAMALVVDALPDAPFGALVAGWDPGVEPDEALVGELRAALAAHVLLVLRGHRRPTDAELIRFAAASASCSTGARSSACTSPTKEILGFERAQRAGRRDRAGRVDAAAVAHRLLATCPARPGRRSSRRCVLPG